MQHLVTLAIPLCALFAPCDPQEAAPAWPPAIHYGDCKDLDHLPVGGVLENRRMRLAGTERTVWPCGGSAR